MQIKYKEIANVLPLPIDEDEILYGICDNVQWVSEKMLFYARKGNRYNSLLDIEEALLKGAYVIHEHKELKEGFYIEDVSTKIKQVLDIFYKDVHYPFKLIGVCGTNGKSSVVSFLQQLLSEYKTMRIGTHYMQMNEDVYEMANTTPDTMMLMQMLELANQHHMEFVFMEVSSHAIDQERIRYLHFDYVIYTNIAQDHLDYHKTLLHYRYTKYKLMQYVKENGVVIANKDELYYQELRQLPHPLLITYGKGASHFHISDITLSLSQTSFFVNRFYFRTQLLGEINVYNICSAIVLLRLLNISYFSIYKRVLQLSAKEGRLQCIYHNEVSVFIDYAHTAKALYEVLRFLKDISTSRLLIVVGCGGNREKEKRSDIGYYASYLSDICIFTEDNSRDEDVQIIFQDMLKNTRDNVVCIENRKDALEYAVNIAQKNDIILVSGKGNENTLEKNGVLIPFLDEEVLYRLVGEKVWD